MNLLLLMPDEIAADGRARVTGTRAAHLIDVLRVVPEQAIRIGLIDGSLGRAQVETVGPGEVEIVCEFEDRLPPVPPIDLLLALPRPKVLRRLWAQLSAIGVGRILLTNAERVERNYFDTHLLSPSGYRPLLIEGLQQARDTRLPVVSVHRRFRVLIEDEIDALVGPACRLVADPGFSVPFADALTAGAESRVLLAIGPEGGWNRFELDLLTAHGFNGIGLGPRTLRTDTACIALLALAHESLRQEASKARRTDDLGDHPR